MCNLIHALQLQTIIEIAQIAWKIFVFVKAYYFKLKKIFPWLSLGRLRDLFILRFLLKKLVLPRVGGTYSGLIAVAFEHARTAMHVLFGEAGKQALASASASVKSQVQCATSVLKGAGVPVEAICSLHLPKSVGEAVGAVPLQTLLPVGMFFFGLLFREIVALAKDEKKQEWIMRMLLL